MFNWLFIPELLCYSKKWKNFAILKTSHNSWPYPEGIKQSSVNYLHRSKACICVIYYVFKWMKRVSYIASSFASTSFCVIVFLFCLHFCLLSHFKIIRCIVKSLIATSKYFLLEYNWKKKRKPEKCFLDTQVCMSKWVIPVSQMAWVHYCL